MIDSPLLPAHTDPVCHTNLKYYHVPYIVLIIKPPKTLIINNKLVNDYEDNTHNHNYALC